MGFLDFIFGGSKSNVETLPDRIWLTSQAKRNGIRKEINEQAQSEPVGLLLVAHFPDVLETLYELQDSIDLSCEVKLASDLSTDLTAFWPADDSRRYFILVAERHPLPAHDDRIVQFAEELPCRCQIAFHVSLEDPLMKMFAGEWVENLLRKLGMDENDAIESQMVARRIHAAQKKIADEAFGDSEARSAAGWLEANVPNLDG